MEMKALDPTDVRIDPMNERQSEVELDDDFIQNVAEVGVVQPPIVRARIPEDNEMYYDAVIGQRRVKAAQAADLDEIHVLVTEWDDHESLKASITENMDLFRDRVPSSDRAQALQQLWEMMGGDGMPTPSHLAAELGVPRETIRTWLEPIDEKWKDTGVDPTSDDSSDAADELGERALAIIRRMTGGGETGEAVVELAAELDATQAELKEAKELVEAEDMDPLDAVQHVCGDDEDTDEREDTRIEVNEVKFNPRTSAALNKASEDFDSPPAALIVSAVDWFLQEEGYLDE